MKKYSIPNRIKCQVCDRKPAEAHHGDAPMCVSCWFDKERKVTGNKIPTNQAHYWSNTKG